MSDDGNELEQRRILLEAVIEQFAGDPEWEGRFVVGFAMVVELADDDDADE